MRRRVRSRLAVAAGVLILLFTLGAAPASAAPVIGNHRVLVVLCNFMDQTDQPNNRAYYQRMYTAAGDGGLGAYDYWQDVSYNKFTINDSFVTDWKTLGITRSAWAALGRRETWRRCVELADVDYSLYRSAIVHFPEAESTLAAAIGMGDTTLTVNSVTAGNAQNFPTGSFTASIDDGNGGNSEAVTITATSGTTFNVTRSATPLNHPAGARIIVSGDLYGFAAASTSLDGNNFTLGGLVLAHDIGLAVAAHEMGHSFDMQHSRQLSTSTADYNDCWDLMSVITCAYPFTPAGGASDEAFGGSSFGGTTKGPGLTGFYLELNSWIESERILTYVTNLGCNQTTYGFAALNHAERPGNLIAKIPATITVATPPPSAGAPPGSATSDFYYLELRSKTGWDRGIPQDSFVLHLRAAGTPHWVQNAGGDGALTNGESFADPAENVYILVNRLNAATFDGDATISTCKIVSQANRIGATSGDVTDQVTLKWRLTVSSGLPIPNAPVTLHVGTQFCNATTNTEGDAQCNVLLSQAPGVKAAKIEYAGDAAVNGVTATEDFTITRESTSLTYTGATTADYGDPFTASARLVDDDATPTPVEGRTVTFNLGSGQTCSDGTNGGGVASCTITVSQAPGIATLASSFAGDSFFEPSGDSDSFEVTRESAIVTYDGATTSDYHDVFTASATVVDDDPTPNPVVGKTITFALGSLATDACSAITDGTGFASCSIIPHQAAGIVNLVSSFAGDTFYLPGSDTDPFEITHEETTLTYTGPTVILAGGTGVTLSARLLEDGLVAPIPSGQTVTLGLGGQTCTGIANAAGNASCNLIYTGALGLQPLTASFAGDAYYEPSSDTTATATVFAFPARGAFTIGDTTAAAATNTTTPVTYWNAKWPTYNVLSGGVAPSPWKGFAATIPLPTSTPPAFCAGNWTTATGASSDPAETVPSYMGVVVTSKVTKSGGTLAGNAVKIVVVKTEPGFKVGPGTTGKGVIVATYCG